SPLGEHFVAKHGLTTGNVERCLRLWFEVNYPSIGFLQNSEKQFWENDYTWAPHHKGGAFRKWYGNNDYVLGYNKFYNKLMDTFPGHRHDNPSFYFKEGITWTDLTSGNFGARYTPIGFTFDVSGPTGFAIDLDIYTTLGFMCSKVVAYFMNIMNPTMHFLVGQMNKLPVLDFEEANDVKALVLRNIAISKEDWDDFETSWDFQIHPLITKEEATKDIRTVSNKSLVDNYSLWRDKCDKRFEELKENEEKINRIFINLYGLQAELSYEVDYKYITVRNAEPRRDIISLLSYAVGCMLGRYSHNKNGIIYAGGEWNIEKYSTFIPDDDNVIPITDEEYLEDDIVSRLCTWLKVVYGEETLEKNLDFIAKVLGNKGSSSREIIRNYFLNDFFKDHCQTYSVTGSGKRPIYWLFDSGKQNGFKALIYLHRYNADTIGNLRIDYLHRMQRIYESEINRMQDMIDHSTSAREAAQATKRREKLTKQLKECWEYDKKLAHLALSRIELDLDDGVKVNYRKLQTGADGKFYEVLADSKNIMMKVKAR
ncbi:MAG: BREX-1 system adenine-specific DNA-methyltransferase PglX, partial [Oscillospiraceae bacterium]|nr:BREX-1 system adenine-specific DNA-methyltransferase PglX [Oscillospiraceae bacterium]